MPKPEIHNPFFYHRGRRFEAIIGKTGKYHHIFGATGGFQIESAGNIKPLLHQLLTLDTTDPILAGILPNLPRLPIFYGFHYESGRLEYDLPSPDTIRITELKPKYNLNWPYENYPESFPSQPFTITEPEPCELATFKAEVWQGIDDKYADHFVAIIPPSDSYQVDLWRPGRNLDDIHLKFFFNPQTQHAVIYNECD